MDSDQQTGGYGNLLGGMGNVDPMRRRAISPYLDLDPTHIAPSAGPEFIFPEGQNERRGRFEMAFSQIGGSVLTGGALGGASGFYNGLRETKAAQLQGAVRRTQVINYLTKQGASTAQTLGIIALYYACFGTLYTKLRDAEDELNTLAAGASTGLLYKSSSGLRQCAKGGLLGLGLATAYVAVTRREQMKRLLGLD